VTNLPNSPPTLQGEWNADRLLSLSLNLHGISVELRTSCASLLTYCRSLFRRYVSPCQRQPGIVLQLELVDFPVVLPALASSGVVVHRGQGIICTTDQRYFFVELDGRGTLVIDRSTSIVTGQVTPVLLTDQNLLNRLLVGSLVLLLREQGIFPVHGFAVARDGWGALFVGSSGTGKTTAGLGLVQAGWGFLSNDLSLLCEAGHRVHVLCSPEQVHITAETASFFPELQPLIETGGGKFAFYVEDIYPHAVVDRAEVKWLLFPRVRQNQLTQLKRMTKSGALIALLPHSLAAWDRAMVPAHFSLLSRLVETALAYRVDLAADFHRLSSLLADLPDETS